MNNIINNKIDNLFYELVKEFKLKSGDISPLQNKKVEDFKVMLKEYIKQNGGLKE